MIANIKINQNALNSILTSQQAKKAIEQKAKTQLSKIKCSQHHSIPTNIKLIENSSSLSIQLECCCGQLKSEIEKFLSK